MKFRPQKHENPDKANTNFNRKDFKLSKVCTSSILLHNNLVLLDESLKFRIDVFTFEHVVIVTVRILLLLLFFFIFLIRVVFYIS